MTEEKTAAESKGDEKQGDSQMVRCGQVNDGSNGYMRHGPCVLPVGHLSQPCTDGTWWCSDHDAPRLGPDCLCIKCVDRALTDRWTESVGLQGRISNLVDEVGHQWSRIKRLEASEPDRRIDEVLVKSYQRVTTLREVLKLVIQGPVVLSAYRAVLEGKSPMEAMDEALRASERERVAIVRAEHREASQWLHQAFALYEDWKSSKLG